MNSRTPMKIGFDGLAVLLASAGMTMATTAESTDRMMVGIILIVLGILTYIVRHTWNQKMLDNKYGNGEESEELKEEEDDIPEPEDWPLPDDECKNDDEEEEVSDVEKAIKKTKSNAKKSKKKITKKKER